MGKYCKINNKKISGVSKEVSSLFSGYAWPGNIRELENAIEGAVIMARTEVVNKWDIPNASKFVAQEAAAIDGKSLKEVLEKPERKLIISILNECGWNRNKAAATLGINRTTLYNKMKKYNISFNKPR